MIPTFKDLDGTLYITLFVSIFFLIMLIFRKNLWNILDPFIFTILNLSFNLTLIFYSYLQNNIKSEYFYYVVVAFAFFCVGFKLAVFLSKKYFRTLNKSFKGPNKTFTILLIGFSMFLFTVNNIYLLSKVGLGIITGQINPDILKVTLTQDGGGIFQKIGVASELLIVPLLVHAYYVFNLKKLVTSTLVYYLLGMVIFNFSKSGLVFILFNVGIVLHYYEHFLNYKTINLKKIILFGAIGLGASLIILVNLATTYGFNIGDLLIDRFIATGGGTYQYFVLEGNKVLDHLSFVDKLKNYFDVFLSSVKLKEWEPLGYIAKMTEYLTGLNLPGFGANPYMFMDGHFLFGWFGVLYCGCLGIAIGLIRSLNLGFINFFIANYLILQLVMDPGITQHNLVALLFFVPLFLFFKIVAELSNKTTTIKILPQLSE